MDPPKKNDELIEKVLAEPSLGRLDEKRHNYYQSIPPLTGCICDNSTNSTTNNNNGSFLYAIEKEWTSLCSNIVCICLAERNDRFEVACQRMHQYGMCRVASFYRPYKPEKPTATSDSKESKEAPKESKEPQEIKKAALLVKNVQGTSQPGTVNNISPFTLSTISRKGRLGCWESHRAVLIDALSRNARDVLVLEDDFMLTVDKTILGHVSSIRRAAASKQALGDACEMFMLGGLPIFGAPSWAAGTDAFRVFAVCMHAYIANQSMMKKVASMSYLANVDRLRGYEEPIDWWVPKQVVQYITFPQFMVQSCESTSDISSCGDSHLDDYFGSPALKFIRTNSYVYEILIYVVEPLILILLLWWIKKKLF